MAHSTDSQNSPAVQSIINARYASLQALTAVICELPGSDIDSLYSWADSALIAIETNPARTVSRSATSRLNHSLQVQRLLDSIFV